MRFLWLLLLVPTAGFADQIRVYGFDMHYTEVGRGPVIVLLHGLWGGTNEWQPILEPLAASHRVIALDAIGFHGSDKPEAAYHNALLAQFLAGFLDTLDLRNVTLMGHAMGANLATYTAVHHPQRISRLVLVDGAGYRNPERDLAAPMSAAMLNFRKIATGSNIAATESFLKRRVLDDSLVTRGWAELAFSMWLRSARAIGDMLREGGDVTPEQMRTIALPTLIVWGENDSVFPIRNGERLHADINGSTFARIAASGHLPQMEQTDEFLSHLLPFLDQQAPD
ncbi:MAG: alpha/beta hydrolase [Pseudomonadota bacterium]